MHKFVHSKQIIERIQEKTGWSKVQIARQLFNISDNNLGNRIRDDRLDFYAILNWAINNNVNIDWLISGKEHTPKISINNTLLQNIITALEEGLERLGRKATPEKKAGLISFLYEHYSKTDEKIEKETIIEHLRLVA